MTPAHRGRRVDTGGSTRYTWSRRRRGRNQVERGGVCVAVLVRSQDGVQAAASQLDSGDDQAVDHVSIEVLPPLLALPEVDRCFVTTVAPGSGSRHRSPPMADSRPVTPNAEESTGPSRGSDGCRRPSYQESLPRMQTAEWAVCEWSIVIDPVTKTRAPKGRGIRTEMRPFAEDELESLHLAASARDEQLADVLLIAGWAGLRWSSFVRLAYATSSTCRCRCSWSPALPRKEWRPR